MPSTAKVIIESASLQHMRRVRSRKEATASQQKFHVVVTAKDYHWWETNYAQILSPTVRESRYVPSSQGPAPPVSPVKHLCMDCPEDISSLANHKKRKRCHSCRDKFKVVSTRRNTQMQRADRESLKRKVPRFCACGTDISGSHSQEILCRVCVDLIRSVWVGVVKSDNVKAEGRDL